MKMRLVPILPAKAGEELDGIVRSWLEMQDRWLSFVAAEDRESVRTAFKAAAKVLQESSTALCEAECEEFEIEERPEVLH